MYGKKLPDSVFENVDADFETADLLIIMGTSLTVHPACNFVNNVRPSTYKLVINNQCVGENLGLCFENKKSKDAILLEGIDEGFLQLASKLGWIDDLIEYKHLMCDNSKCLLEKFIKK